MGKQHSNSVQKLILKHLSVVNYKNIHSSAYAFDKKINCFVGNNGTGKTNTIDAIYHLAMGKSYFNTINNQNIHHDEKFMMIEGSFEKGDKEETVLCSMKKGLSKTIKKNGKAYEKFSEHIGFIPIVMISPADRDLIVEGSSTRRKFLDSIIGQSDKVYLKALIDYQRVLTQRNSLLKQFAKQRYFDSETLNIYNEQLCALSPKIFETRKQFLEEFIPIFQERYAVISNDKENVHIHYESHLFEDDLATLLQNAAQKDQMLQYTSKGVHKDDLNFEMKGYPIKKFGSQGQQKSFLMALKLAQFDYLKQHAQTMPILLLDDIFDKLDDQRVAQLISLVEDDTFGQLFLTDTHAQRTEEVVKKTQQTYKIFEL